MTDQYHMHEVLGCLTDLSEKIVANRAASGPEPKRSADLVSLLGSSIALLQCARSKCDPTMYGEIDEVLDCTKSAFDIAKADFDAVMAVYLADSPSGSYH